MCACLGEPLAHLAVADRPEEREHDQRHDDHHDDGDGGAERPVVLLAEQVLDGVADHRAAGAADERGRDVVADSRDEDEQRRRDDADV